MLGRKRKSRLGQFQRNAAGAYVYTGDWYVYGGERPRGRAMGILGILCGLPFACLLCGGLAPVPGMTGYWYGVIPYVLSLASSVSLLYSAGRLILAGDPVREDIYETATVHLPRRALLTAVLAALALLGEGVFLLLHGAAGGTIFAASYLGLTAMACGSSLGGGAFAARLTWRKR